VAETFWNSVFSKPEYHYGTSPNDFLRDKVEHYVLNGQWFAILGIDLPEELHVVEFAAGEGRNSVWLAQQGFQVTAFDLSDVGMKKARELARQHDVVIDTRTDDAIDLGLNATGWRDSADVLVSTFFHVSPERKRNLLAAHRNILRSGGILIAEWFHPDQRLHNHSSGGPGSSEMMFTAAELRTHFADWLVLECRETTRTLAEGDGHQGTAAVTQLVAQKRGMW